MTRNLDHRFEVMAPVYSASLREELTQIFDLQLRDNTKARILNANQDNTMQKIPGKKIRAPEDGAAIVALMSALDGGRIVAVDIGSNAVRLLSSRIIVADGGTSSEKGDARPDAGASGRRGLYAGRLVGRRCRASEPDAAGLPAFGLGALEPRAMRILATAALREAENGRAVVERLAAETGFAH